MELQWHRHDWVRRSPDWLAATVAGFVAGAAVMVLELFWATSVDGSPLTISRMVASIVMGPSTLTAATGTVAIMAVALITHYVLGIVFAMILATVLIAPFRLDSSLGTVFTTGAVFGAVLYMVNFYGMAQIFSWFAELRGWATFIAHMVFGMVAAGLYWKFERVEADR